MLQEAGECRGQERKRLGLSLLLDKDVEDSPDEEEKDTSTANIEKTSEINEIENEDDAHQDKNLEETQTVSKADNDESNDAEDSSEEDKVE